MVSFAFLFLGLILGVHDVTLRVEGEVAAVQLLLDGEEIGNITGEPWSLECDFGARLAPHILEAVAFDSGGHEIDRTRQLINLPRERAETAILLQGENPRRPEAVQLAWQHIEFGEAERVGFLFNGEALPLDQPNRAVLPAYDPAHLQVLQASARFADGSEYQAELTFGGPTMFGAQTEITGITIVSARPDPPNLRSLEGRFRSGGEPLRVVGVERAPARIAMVIDQTALPALRVLGQFGSNLTDSESALRPGEELVFLFPEVKMVADDQLPARLFSMTQEFTSRDGSSIPWILTRVSPPETEPQPYRRISDAIAVAGIEAARGNQPRAVVLVLGDRIDDTSADGADETRRFLQDLLVPLFIWWTGRISEDDLTSEDRRQMTQRTPWGPADDISSFTRIMAATARLRAELDQQLTVWVEGSFLPQNVEIAKGVRGLRPAG